MPDQIPFKEAGIEENIGIRISGEIDKFTTKRPNASIDIQKVSEAVGSPAMTVKRVFYLLLGMQLLKATFLPRHKACDGIIGQQETSVEMISHKALNGGYGSFCPLCFEPFETSKDIEIQIVFWKPGAKIGL